MLHPLTFDFDSLFETVGAIFICELSNDGNGLVRLHLCVEDFLLDTLVDVIGDSSYKHALCEVGDFGSRDKAIELGGDRGRLVVAVDSHRLSLLEDFSEAFEEGLGSFTYDLTAKDFSHGVLDNFTFLVTIVTHELREVLEAKTNYYLVRASCGVREIL